MGKYFNMNELEVGTQLKIKKTGIIGTLKVVHHYPTTFTVEFEDGSFQNYKTNEIELVQTEDA
ncbi:MAG: hypothetical protein H8E72_00885 [Candidatus Marinimicrobia bacterium]|nr:hypothetical protein [Candidatus Neomarinimicrobiota bacterium]